MNCNVCGKNMIGNGYSTPFICPDAFQENNNNFVFLKTIYCKEQFLSLRSKTDIEDIFGMLTEEGAEIIEIFAESKPDQKNIKKELNDFCSVYNQFISLCEEEGKKFEMDLFISNIKEDLNKNGLLVVRKILTSYPTEKLIDQKYFLTKTISNLIKIINKTTRFGFFSSENDNSMNNISQIVFFSEIIVFFTKLNNFYDEEMQLSKKEKMKKFRKISLNIFSGK